MPACEMAEIRDRFVDEAVALATRGDVEGARERLDRAARVWPVEPEQLERVQATLDRQRAAAGQPSIVLPDPNRFS